MFFWWDMHKQRATVDEKTERQKLLNDLDNRMGEFLNANREQSCGTVIDTVKQNRQHIRAEREAEARS